MGLDLDDAGFAFRRFQQHDAAPGLAVIDLGPVGFGMDVAPRQVELVADLARHHPGDAENHIPGAGGRTEVVHRIDDGIAGLRDGGAMCCGVEVEPG